MSRNRMGVAKMNLTSLMEKPRETVVIFVSPQEVTVQGKSVVQIADVLASDAPTIAPIGERLAEVAGNVIGLKTKVVAESQEVTILADRTVPFSVVKKVMSTCTSQGYEHISLAVLQKAPETQVSQI
jgi:biopolymer transport protein ExbD